MFHPLLIWSMPKRLDLIQGAWKTTCVSILGAAGSPATIGCLLLSTPANAESPRGQTFVVITMNTVVISCRSSLIYDPPLPQSPQSLQIATNANHATHTTQAQQAMQKKFEKKCDYVQRQQIYESINTLWQSMYPAMLPKQQTNKRANWMQQLAQRTQSRPQMVFFSEMAVTISTWERADTLWRGQATNILIWK